MLSGETRGFGSSRSYDTFALRDAARDLNIILLFIVRLRHQPNICLAQTIHSIWVTNPDTTMEALGGAASVFTLTSVAIQSAKTIFETVNGIKNGPEEVKDLTFKVDHLCRTLEHVLEISRKIYNMDGEDVSELQRLMDRCRQDLYDSKTA